MERQETTWSQIEHLLEEARGSFGKAEAMARGRTQAYDNLAWLAGQLEIIKPGTRMLRVRVTDPVLARSMNVSSLFVFGDGTLMVPAAESKFTWHAREFGASKVRELLQSPRGDGWMVDLLNVVAGNRATIEIINF